MFDSRRGYVVGLWSSGTTPHSHCGNGSSILPRSKRIKFAGVADTKIYAQVVELADTRGLGPRAVRRGGSNALLGINLGITTRPPAGGSRKG